MTQDDEPPSWREHLLFFGGLAAALVILVLYAFDVVDTRGELLSR